MQGLCPQMRSKPLYTKAEPDVQGKYQWVVHPLWESIAKGIMHWVKKLNITDIDHFFYETQSEMKN